jgi:putative oxidoreductase
VWYTCFIFIHNKNNIMTKNICNKNTGLLIMRLGLGTIFLVHGILKLTNMDGTIGFFGQIGLSPAFAWIVAIIETVGGAFMILGLFTSVVGVLLALIMLVAFLTVKLPMGGMLAFTRGEIDIALFVLSLGLASTGAGKYAISSLCRCGKCMFCKNRDAHVCGTDGNCGCSCTK